MQLLIALLAWLGVVTASDNAIFQGFSHAWQRRIVGEVATPHRISNLAAIVDSANASAFVSFSPGVDGDFAFPTALFARVNASASNVRIDEDAVSLRFTDNATDVGPHNYPVATSSESIAYKFTLPSADTAHAVVLRGFSLHMHCDDAKQPKGFPCNSNGVWANIISMSIDDCTVSGLSASCNVNFYLQRGWNPDGVTPPKGKAFNFVIDYSIDVSLSILTGAPSDLNVVSMPPAQVNTTLWAGDWHNTSVSATGAPSNAFGSAVVALRAWRFSITAHSAETAKLPLGRYLEGLRFFIASSDYTPSTGSVHATVSTAVWNPKTSWNNAVALSLTPVLLQLSSTSSAPSPSHQAAAAICVTGDPGIGSIAFSCKRRHLPERTNATVPISL